MQKFHIVPAALRWIVMMLQSKQSPAFSALVGMSRVGVRLRRVGKVANRLRVWTLRMNLRANCFGWGIVNWRKEHNDNSQVWIPACAGMTMGDGNDNGKRE